jgi:hypothetical protein
MNRHFLGDTAIMPIAMMLLFVYVLGGAIRHGPGSYVTYPRLTCQMTRGQLTGG